MVEIAPRYDRRILDAVRALDDRTESIAEISRRIGVAAAQLGLPKPSYVHLRRYIVAHREAEDAERARRDQIRKILWDAYYDFMQSRVIDAYEVAERIREARR
jgi:23S rRNA maturation-related 3'-5' exoribonuclease YhaM